MKKILMVLIIPAIIYSQEFQITSDGSRRFAVDTFAKDIYWQELNTGIIYKTNISTMETETTVFPSFPIFANRSHLAAYESDEKLYLYNFETGETKLLLEDILKWPYFFSFSPNDQFIMVHNIFFDLNENIKYTSPYNNIWMKPSWSSDTTLFFGDNYYIENYNFISDTRDTTFLFTDSLFLYSFDYSIKNKILAYSVEDVNAEPNNTLLKFFYIEEEKDSLIFDQWTGITEGACSHSYMAFTYLKWSRDEKRISFYSDPIINSGSGVLVHFLDSSFTKLYTRCDQYGVKVDTEWLGNDTIIYADLTRNQIYGFDIVSPLTGIEKNCENMPKSFQLGNYPNPFNPVTIIDYTIPVSGMITIKIFDTLGREVATLINERKSVGNYNVIFNAVNLPSGVYYYTLITDSKRITKSMVLLK
ncbi:MAG: T9SS type A sorting domain-containing protein [Chlorobi bacterium]|nr:T9SS type A sorting domain-containing protein [Chlorobiota bacterium]